MHPVDVLFGLGVGILVGLTGMGGGSLMTPLLIVVGGVPPVTAIGTDLFYGAVTKTVGGWRHLRQRTVDQGLSRWICYGSVPAAIAGTFTLKAMEHAAGPDFAPIVLGAVAGALLLASGATFARIVIARRRTLTERESAVLTPAAKLVAVLVGVLVGFVLGLTSSGSGTLVGVALMLLFRLSPRRVVGTDVFQAALLLWAAALAHIVVGDIDFALAGTLLIGSIPGVWLGARWSARVNAGALRTALAVVLLGGGLGLLAKAGAAIPEPVLVAVPVLAAVALLAPKVQPRLLALRAER